MRRLFFCCLLTLAIVGLVASPAAQAASPTPTPFQDSESFTDPDFCGTGGLVNGTFAVKGVEFLTPNGGIDYRRVDHGVTTFTNPVTGAAVQVRFAEQVSVVLASGDPNGAHVEYATFKGLPEMIKQVHGGVLARDAGFVTFRSVFNANGDFIGQTVAIEKGPHDDLDSGFALFCDVIVPALGLG